eukprot:CAMPEP_0173438002 /NCGR_PEP_ID=MMETSP1357-20121228/19097_1 /TAXON_ID=77926 /ORGANISM="Hemiselmis rufescens, Strain PCC563" /LENGTH=76 /DNA_ID=CAMNT_0014403241 /DNA_START=7 /DNA_END=235 /DNA_ORIENTATION=+
MRRPSLHVLVAPEGWEGGRVATGRSLRGAAAVGARQAEHLGGSAGAEVSHRGKGGRKGGMGRTRSQDDGTVAVREH